MGVENPSTFRFAPAEWYESYTILQNRNRTTKYVKIVLDPHVVPEIQALVCGVKNPDTQNISFAICKKKDEFFAASRDF